MFKRASVIILTLLIVTIPLSLSARRFARWWTTMGSFTADLRDEIVPITANNFILLANNGFYDGLHFHRVIEGFMIQDGCPFGTGTGGPGWTIEDEFSPLLLHDSAGVLAMARTSQPHSAGSQYYITLAPTHWLDGGYAVFGKVFQGLDVVMSIGSVPTDANDHPVNNVYIDSLKILNMAINSVTPSNDSTVVYNHANPSPFVVEAYGFYENVEFAWYIDDVLQPDYVDFMMDPVFTTNGMHSVKCVTTDSELSWTTAWQVSVSNVSSSDPLSPVPDITVKSAYPNPFHTSTSLIYNINKGQPVSVSIYDVKGRIVSTNKINAKSGVNIWKWDGNNSARQASPAGIYFISLAVGNVHSVQKVILIK